jgi:hypothetical protein
MGRVGRDRQSTQRLQPELRQPTEHRAVGIVLNDPHFGEIEVQSVAMNPGSEAGKPLRRCTGVATPSTTSEIWPICAPVVRPASMLSGQSGR